MNITDRIKEMQSEDTGASPNNKPEKPSNPDDVAKKIKLAVFGILGAIILGVMIFSFTSNKGPEEPKEPEIVEKEDETKDVEDGTPVEKDDEGEEDDVENLTKDDVRDDNVLKPNDKLPDEETKDAEENLGSALDYLQGLDSGDKFDPLASKGLNKTPSHILENIRYALMLGYEFDFDEIEWFASTRDNVYQFILPMYMEGDVNIILTGNYINTTNEINISKVQGSPSSNDLVSPDNTPQDGS